MNEMLGNKYRDVVTDFVGVCTGYVDYLTGCNQVLLVAKVNDDGDTKSKWVDVQRVEQVEAPRVVLDNGDTPGSDEAPPLD